MFWDFIGYVNAGPGFIPGGGEREPKGLRRGEGKPKKPKPQDDRAKRIKDCEAQRRKEFEERRQAILDQVRREIPLLPSRDQNRGIGIVTAIDMAISFAFGGPPAAAVIGIRDGLVGVGGTILYNDIERRRSASNPISRERERLDRELKECEKL
jgi:hypothetical protein